MNQSMVGYVSRRALISLVAIWGAVTLVYLVIRLVPGDPIALMSEDDISVEAREEIRQLYGLDRPIIVQYAEYLPRVATLDLGDSLVSRRPAVELVLQRLPATLQMAFSAMAIAVVVGVPAGILAGRHSGGIADRVVSSLSLVGQSLPSFWVGIMLLLVFARVLHWLPSMGSGSILHLILPAVTLALPLIAILARMVRQGVVEVIDSAYVEAARGKGFSEGFIMRRHILRNTMIPVITIIGLQLGDLLTGSVIVETIYSWPGIGNLLISSIFRRDYPVVQAVMLLVAIVFVGVNLVVDLVYGYLDPRVRLEETT
jgi:peptide/nickel transport system permease protein